MPEALLGPGAFAADTANLLYIRDVVPHLRAALQSPRTRNAAGALLAMLERGEEDGAAELLAYGTAVKITPLTQTGSGGGA